MTFDFHRAFIGEIFCDVVKQTIIYIYTNLYLKDSEILLYCIAMKHVKDGNFTGSFQPGKNRK